MIDPLNENVISLNEACKLLPTRRRGKRPHLSCLYRWTTTGCRGIVLESVQIGGTRCTSVEALARFFNALTRATGSPVDRRPDRRQRADAAMRELEEEGI